MNEVELQNLIVRLTGDGTEFQAMLKEAAEATKKVEHQVEEAGESIIGVRDHMDRFARSALFAVQSIGIYEFFKESQHEYANAETQLFKLNSVLKANGRQTKQVSEDYVEFADKIQSVSTYDNDLIINLLKTAESFDLTGSAAKGAVKEALQLAKAVDIDPSSALRVAQAMAAGDVERARRFSRPISQLRGVKDEAEFIEKYTKLVKSGVQTMTDELETHAGRAQHTANRMGDVMKEMGKIFYEILDPVKSAKKKLIEFWEGLGQNAKRTIVYLGTAVSATIMLGPLISLYELILPILQSGFMLVGTSLLGLASKVRMLGVALTYVINPIKLVTTSLFILRATASGVWAGAGAGLTGFKAMLLTLINPIKMATGALTVLRFAMLKVLLNPVVLIIAVLVSMVAALVEASGGLRSTWDRIKQAGFDLWDGIKAKVKQFLIFIRPVAMALASFFTTAWDMIKRGSLALWTFIFDRFNRLMAFVNGVWKSIGGTAEINWRSIRDTIRDTILFAEYTLLHFEDVADYVWVSVKLGFVQFVAEVVYFFTEVLPGFLSWMGKNWASVLTGMITLTFRFFSNLIETFRKLPELISGQVDFSSIWKDTIKDSFKNVQAIKLPDRVIGELEKGILAEFNAKGDALKRSFEQFRADKLAEFAKEHPEIIKAADNLGEAMGEHIAKGAKSELDKLDAALTHSAEGIFRVRAYLDKINEMKTKKDNKLLPPGVIAGAGLRVAIAVADQVNKNADAQKLLAMQAEKNNERNKDVAPFKAAAAPFNLATGGNTELLLTQIRNALLKKQNATVLELANLE